jgi:hypothetical protein
MLIDNPIIRTSLRFTPGTEVIGASGSFTGSFSGSFEGNVEILDKLVFRATDNFLITSQSNDTTVTVGNEFNNFENTQTTIFKNAEVIVSGSAEVEILKLKPLEEEPEPVEGGLYYSTNGNFFAALT